MTRIEEILCDLINIKTDPSVYDNSDIVNYITNILKKNDIIFKTIPNPENKNLKNIIAGININQFNNISDGIILSGHMDTVGVKSDEWTTNPFHGTIKDGKVYGRGTMDMKQFIAIVLSLLPQLKEIQMPIFLAFSCDEETNVLGVQQIVDFLKKNNITPKYTLVGEATDFKLCVANRGYVGYQTKIKGIAGHAGSPELGVNANYIAAKIISKIEALNKIYTKKGTTLNVGVINGGLGRNLISEYATIDWEIRYSTSQLLEQILNEMNQFYKELKTEYLKSQITVDKKETLPVFEQKKDNKITQEAKRILNTEEIQIAYASEAGFFQEIGTDTIMCGAGDSKLAHTTDEYVQITDLYKYSEFLEKLIKSFIRK